MNNYNDRGGNRGGFKPRGGKFGGRPSFGGNRDRGPVTMHEATCAECGNRCEVPFRPSGDKPVYCSNCFGGKREGGDRGPRQSFDRPNYSKPSFGGNRGNRPAAGVGNEDIKRELQTMSAKIGELTRTIERLVEGQSAAKPAVKTKKETIRLVVGEPVATAKKSTAKKSVAKKSAKAAPKKK